MSSKKGKERGRARERDLGWQGQSSPVTFLDDASMPFDCPPSLQYLESTHPPFSLLFRLPLSLPSTSLTFPSHPTLLPTTSLFSFPFPLLETLSYSFTLLYSFLLLFSPSLVVLDRRCIKKHKKRVTTCSTPLRIHITITALKFTRRFDPTLMFLAKQTAMAITPSCPGKTKGDKQQQQQCTRKKLQLSLNAQEERVVFHPE